MKRNACICTAVICALIVVAVSLKNTAQDEEEYFYALKGISYSMELLMTDVDACNANAYRQHYSLFLKSVGRTQQAKTMVYINDNVAEKVRTFLLCSTYIDSLLKGPFLIDDCVDTYEFKLAKQYFEILSHSLTNATSFKHLLSLLDDNPDVAAWVIAYQEYRESDGNFTSARKPN